MLALVVVGPVLTVIGALVLGLQRYGVKLPPYVAPTSRGFDAFIAGCFVVAGLGLSAGSLAYAAVSGLTSSRGAGYSAWVIVGALVTLAGADVARKRRRANTAPGRHTR
jgi:hypothetical protein